MHYSKAICLGIDRDINFNLMLYSLNVSIPCVPHNLNTART
jgi:hypothetical protein